MSNKELNIEPNEDLDQYFMTSERVINREVKEAELNESETVLEIGGGTGELTEKLSEKAEKVITVEKDERLAEILEEKFENTNVDVIHGDFNELKDDLLEFDKCVSNPPYSISSEIVEFLGVKGKLSVLLIQEEFARKLVAEPGSNIYTFTTVLTNYRLIPVFLEKVSSNNFEPEPEVDSALVKFYPRKKDFGTDYEKFRKTSKALFTNKRKKVRNSIVDSRHILGMSKKKVKSLRDELPYSDERVINLDTKKIADISKKLEDY